MMWTSLNLADWQLALSPLLFFVAWRFLRVPASLLFFACLLVLFLAQHARSYSVSSDGGFILARFHNDPNEFIAYQFRSEVNQDIAPQLTKAWHSARLARFPKQIHSEQQARKLLDDDHELQLVTWEQQNAANGRRWVWLSMQPTQAIDLAALASQKLPRYLQSLRLIKSVPASGFSYEPRGESAAFLAYLVSGLAGAQAQASAEQRELAILSLSQALAIEGGWTSYAHRSLAGLFLGNAYFQTAISSSNFGRTEAACAIGAYQQALGLIRPGDNPELEAALFNNLGVALYIRAYFESLQEDAKSAHKAWRSAVKTLGQPNPFSNPFVAARIAKWNFQYARDLRGEANNKESQ